MIYIEDSEENYTSDGHRKVSEQCREDGMFCVNYTISHMSAEWNWLIENEIFDLVRCSFMNEIWFDKESDAMAFKLTWMMD